MSFPVIISTLRALNGGFNGQSHGSSEFPYALAAQGTEQISCEVGGQGVLCKFGRIV